MAFVVFEEPYRRRFHASVFSLATCYMLGYICIAVIVPYLIAYASGGFWQKQSTYEEQANVHYKFSVLAVLDTSAGSSIVWSTDRAINLLLNPRLRCPLLTTRERDDNRDGKTDMFVVSMTMPLASHERVVRAAVLLLFDYQLQDNVRLSMEGLAFIQGQSPLAGRQLMVDGELRFQQRIPLRTEQALLDSSNLLDVQPLLPDGLSLPSLLERYLERNFTTKLESQYSVWSLADHTGSSDGGAVQEDDAFEVLARIRVPVDTIRYYPGAAELIKFAWIQYLCIALVVWCFMNRATRLLFANQVLVTPRFSDNLPFKQKL